jgi:putative transposase
VPDYRRACQPGGTFFLTLVTHGRVRLFDDPAARRCLHESITLARRDRTFDLLAAVLLPEHLHLLITLPDGDADFSIRIAAIKGRFSRRWLAANGAEAPQSASRTRQQYRGLWQKRFWEHTVRDDADLTRCCDYIHFNPVKHRHATCPHAWSWTTFHRFVRERRYDADWCCACNGRTPADQFKPPADVPGAEMD